MLLIRNISYLLPMCCNFSEKYKNSPKTGLGCSTPLSAIIRKNWQNILRRRVYIIEHYTIAQAHVSGASNIK